MRGLKTYILFKNLNDILKKLYQKCYTEKGKKQKSINYAKRLEAKIDRVKAINLKKAELRKNSQQTNNIYYTEENILIQLTKSTIHILSW